MNLDDFIPNFSLFIMRLLPGLLFATFFIIMVTFWLNRRMLKPERDERDWMTILIWGSLLYLIVPIWRVIEFLRDEKSWSDLVEELFVDDFKNYMFLMLVVGIFGAMMILKRKIFDKVIHGEVVS